MGVGNPSMKDPNMQKISVLIGIGFVDMLGFARVFPLLPFYALRLQADAWVIGWMIASFSIAQLASAPIGGRVSDRFGRRPALMVGLARRDRVRGVRCATSI
jgi:MFS family permease